MLKVVHLNTYDGNGGAGRACIRLNRALLSQNIDSKIIVNYKFGKNPQIKTFNENLIQKRYALSLSRKVCRAVSSSRALILLEYGIVGF